MVRRLSDLEQDVLDACHDLHGGPQRSLQRLFSDVRPAELEEVLARLASYGLVWRDRGDIGDEDGVLEENIWTLTPAGATQLSP
jgi:hypothetical protein